MIQIDDISTNPHAAYHSLLKSCREQLWHDQIPIQVAPQDITYTQQDNMHFHAHPEIFIQLSGCNHFECPNASFDLNAYSIAVVPAGVPHGETFIPDKTNGEFLCLVIMPSHGRTGILSAYTAHDQPRQIVHYVDYPRVAFKTFNTLLQQAISLESIARQHVLASLCTILLQVMQEKPSEDTDQYSEKIHSCRNIILERFSESQCNVQALARELGCTPNYLSARFKKECGESISHFLNHIRLGHAADLLLNTDLNIQQIAWSCGYNAASYFIARFQEAYGETPGSFKR